MKKKTTSSFLEESAVLVGCRGEKFIVTNLQRKQLGQPASVEIPWDFVLDQEEKYQNVFGFWHTHPPGCRWFSTRDADTMDQWTRCLGKPLICAIECEGKLRAWMFYPDGACREIQYKERIGDMLVIRC